MISSESENGPKESPSAQSMNVGARFYRAPEIFCQKADYREDIDLWSTGCVLSDLMNFSYDPVQPVNPIFMTKGSNMDKIKEIVGKKKDKMLFGEDLDKDENSTKFEELDKMF